MDESVEQEEEVIIEPIEEPVSEKKSIDDEMSSAVVESSVPVNIPEEEAPPAIVPSVKNTDSEPVMTRLTFTDYDKVVDERDQIQEVNAPKTIERLEQISTSRTLQRKLEEAEEAENDGERIQIHADDSVDLRDFDILEELDGKPRSDSFDLNIEELV
jgi:hypothetical protein